MTPRERVLAAIAHREPDHVPIDQGSMRSTGIMAIAYNRLKQHLRIDDPPTKLYDVIQQLAQPDDWYLERFHVDAVDLGRCFEPRGGWREWRLPDGSAALAPGWFEADREDGALVTRDAAGAVIGRMPDGALYIDQALWPLSAPGGLDHCELLEEKMAQVIWAALPTTPFDHPLTNQRLEEIAGAARQYHAATDRAVSAAVGCNLLEWSQFLFGMENTFLYMAGEKRKFASFLDRLTELHLQNLARILPRLRGSIDILVVGDDLGMQSGPQMSRPMYRELFFPRHRRIYEYAKRESGAHLFMHNCGGTYELIPDLIEAGVEIFNPVQTSARGMEPGRLKREFGRDCTFWGGGCDTQHVLPKGSLREIRDDVQRRIDTFAPGGGFVWAPIHNIMADVPPENAVAMLEAAYEFG